MHDVSGKLEQTIETLHRLTTGRLLHLCSPIGIDILDMRGLSLLLFIFCLRPIQPRIVPALAILLSSNFNRIICAANTLVIRLSDGDDLSSHFSQKQFVSSLSESSSFPFTLSMVDIERLGMLSSTGVLSAHLAFQ